MTNSYIRAWLDSKDFYELCQAYRHAPDLLKPLGNMNAAEVFEHLKDEIEKRSGGPSSEYTAWIRDLTIDECAVVCEKPGKRLGDSDSYWGPEYAKRIRALRSDATPMRHNKEG